MVEVMEVSHPEVGHSGLHPSKDYLFANENKGRGGFQPSYGPPAAVLGMFPTPTI